MADVDRRIRDFLAGSPHAVAGASADRAKYGNKVLRCYLQHRMPVFVVHPSEAEIERQRCFKTLGELPATPHGLSVITPPPVSLRLVDAAAAAGIRRLWLQPGAEDRRVLERAAALGLDVIAGGPCLLVTLGFHEDD
jgi:predicted CoA-binding protein